MRPIRRLLLRIEHSFRIWDDDDVVLNQPVRAWFRCITWGYLAAVFATVPLGWLLWLFWKVWPSNYWLANFTNLFLSPVLIQLGFLLFLVAWVPLSLMFLRSRVPPPMTGKLGDD